MLQALLVQLVVTGVTELLELKVLQEQLVRQVLLEIKVQPVLQVALVLKVKKVK